MFTFAFCLPLLQCLLQCFAVSFQRQAGCEPYENSQQTHEKTHGKTHEKTHEKTYSNIVYKVAKTHRMPEVAGHFCKRATNYMALLQKMTHKDKVSYDSTPPCTKRQTGCEYLSTFAFCLPLLQCFAVFPYCKQVVICVPLQRQTNIVKRHFKRHIASRCSTLQHTLQHSASLCNSPCSTLQHARNRTLTVDTATRCNTHCNTHCNTLQHTATHGSTLQHALQHTLHAIRL